jgi:hypothetical protein
LAQFELFRKADMRFAFKNQFLFFALFLSSFAAQSEHGQQEDQAAEKSGIETAPVASQMPVADWLPVFSRQMKGITFDSLAAAEAASIEYCKTLKDPNSIRQTVFGFGFAGMAADDVDASFPYSLTKASRRHRQQLINCSEVKVKLERWTFEGTYRAIDSKDNVVILLGLLGGDLARPAPGKFGAYASLHTECVARNDADRALMESYFRCSEYEQDYEKYKGRLDKAVASNSASVETYKKIMSDIEKSKPVGCDQIKAEFAARAIPVTKFPKFEDIECLKK